MTHVFPCGRSTRWLAWLSGAALTIAAGSCAGSSGADDTEGAAVDGGATGSGGKRDAASGRGGTGGTDRGTGGVPASAGSAAGGAGDGGASAAGGAAAGATGDGGAPASGGASGDPGGGGAAAVGPCPADAHFCSGFEDTGLPAGVTYLADRDFGSNGKPDWTKGVVLDTAIRNTGKQAAKFLPHTGRTYFSVPAGRSFWSRVYFRTDVAVGPGAGHSGHDAFMVAAWAGNDAGVQIVEENCQLAVNINDTRYGSNGTTNQSTACPADGKKLDADTWYCIEAHFDSSKGDFEVFVDGQSVLSKTGIAGAMPGTGFTSFRFGYFQYHQVSRTTWYDDVAVAPQRIGCAAKP